MGARRRGGGGGERARCQRHLLREEPGTVAAAVDGVLAARRAVSEVQLDALLVHAAEQLILAVFRHRQLLQRYRLFSQKRLR